MIDFTSASIDVPLCNISSELDVNPKSVICCEPEIVPPVEPPPPDSNVVTLPSIEDENEPVNIFNSLTPSAISNAFTLLLIEPVNVFNKLTSVPSTVTCIIPLPESSTIAPTNFIWVTSAIDSNLSSETVNEYTSATGIAMVTSPEPLLVTVPPVTEILSTSVTVVEPSDTCRFNCEPLSIDNAISPLPLSVTVAP